MSKLSRAGLVLVRLIPSVVGVLQGQEELPGPSGLQNFFLRFLLMALESGTAAWFCLLIGLNLSRESPSSFIPSIQGH